MQLKDYIFYRMYLAYEKHEGDGKFSAVLYIAAMEFLLILPLIMLIGMYFRNKEKMIVVGLIIFIPLILAFLLNYKCYFKKGKIEQLKSRFKNSKYNHRIKNWMLYLLPFFLGAWGFLGVMPIGKFLQLLLSLIKG